ncbi:branched-chain amino acid ABC transporter permease, partial [Bacteroides thetaiotaomicron]|nr:branched-chain amino acid ABC transporter permease [Bacteroides thetaiotaomicron]
MPPGAAAAPRAQGWRCMLQRPEGWLAVVAACVLPLALSSGSLATEVLVFALAALGCNLLLGYTGLLSFGQGIFFG